MDVLLCPAHLGNVDKALDPGFEFDERTIFGDVGDAAVELGADRILGRRAFPRIALELLHAQRDTLRIAVDADDLHLHRIADARSEEHTSELQSLMRISYADFCLKKQK